VLRVAAGPNGIDVESILATLARQGLRRIFIEGGGVTVSRFLLAGVLNRLHITVSPLVMGAGIPAFDLPALPSLGKAQRFGWSVYPIGPDILLDIPLGQGA
jgi:riboflavin biosynthesis pyrimidine reductase